MSNYKGPTEGGSGGKRGHSSMEHWTETAELKESSKIHRRAEDKKLSRDAVNSMPKNGTCDECGSIFNSEKSNYVALCPECAYWLYDGERCEHVMSGERCMLCGWDGTVSEYIAFIKESKTNE